MAKQGFRLGSKTKVEIEVNDKGETVSFDFADPSFLNNAQEMMLKVEDLEKEFKETGKFLDGLNDGEIENHFLDDEMIDLGKGIAKYFKGLREAIDMFLGKNASEKMFGEDNYLTMFNDMMDALEPYLDKASELQKKNMQKAQQTALNKIPQNNKRAL